jgi:magnesium transporter
MARWIDLVDPGEDELRAQAPVRLDPSELDALLRPPGPEGAARPSLHGHGDRVFGVLLAPVAVPEQDRVYYQEVDLVLTHDSVLTLRKTPPGESPFDPEPIRAVIAARGELSPGMIAFHVVDEVAERFLDLLEAIDAEIDELEEHVDDWSGEQIHRRLTDLRHDLLHIRRTLGPTRDAVRGVVDGRVDLEGRPLFRREVFPREVEARFADAYDKLLRASEAFELSRDLLAAVRDYQQSQITINQNDVVKRLTAIASLLLFPTFWVGVYGQNFDHMPELGWRLGYAYSWGVIVVTTIAQLLLFRRFRWI